MKLTTKGRYAVMALADLASRNEPRPVPLADIAERQDISLSYLEQLFARMRRGGLVKSVRGPGGGYLLAREMKDIVVADVVRAVEDDGRRARCAPSDPHSCLCAANDAVPTRDRCATHDLWHALGNEVETFLSRVTLDDVLSGSLRQDPGYAREMLATGE
jgi:Rrf2 family iron-sulfur cluster assembly transcriptional regulator